MSWSNKHIHKYQRSRDNKSVYRCVLSDCRHYDKNSNLEGKFALCNNCGIQFTLTWYNLTKQAKPKCLNCSRTKAGERFRSTKSFLEGIFEKTGTI